MSGEHANCVGLSVIHRRYLVTRQALSNPMGTFQLKVNGSRRVNGPDSHFPTRRVNGLKAYFHLEG